MHTESFVCSLLIAAMFDNLIVLAGWILASSSSYNIASRSKAQLKEYTKGVHNILRDEDCSIKAKTPFDFQFMTDPWKMLPNGEPLAPVPPAPRATALPIVERYCFSLVFTKLNA